MAGELGAFLRARRADVRPGPGAADVAGRRRVTGLRREEVAAAAGISVDYYTRLEQGRETNPGDSVVAALARVLHLGPDAVDHVRRLRGPGSPSHGGASAPVEREASVVERMLALVETLRPAPAYVLDRLADVVAANPEGLALLDGLADLAAERRNTCRYLVTHPRAREVFPDWEEVARGAVAHLRAVNADDLRGARLQAMVTELRAGSAEFDQWWDGHLVQRRRAAAERLRGRDGTVTTRRYEVLHLPEDGLRLTIWLPVDAGTQPAGSPEASGPAASADPDPDPGRGRRV